MDANFLKYLHSRAINVEKYSASSISEQGVILADYTAGGKSTQLTLQLPSTLNHLCILFYYF
jgi:phage baseplate assembly protein gpV